MIKIQIIKILQNTIKSTQVYIKQRVLLVCLLGFSSGLPLALTGETLKIWMTEAGVDIGSIGLYGLIGLPYTIKFLWAPVVDAFSIPVLTRLLGRRRSWLIVSQIALMIAIILLGSLAPKQDLWWIALAALLVATVSATQDIVIDAFRVETLQVNEQAAGTAVYVAAYRIAMLLSTAGLIFFVAYLEKTLGLPKESVWFYGYNLAALFVAIGICAVLIANEPKSENLQDQDEHKTSFTTLYETAHSAFSDFFKMSSALTILCFIVLFKFCDALAGSMTAPFVLAIGFEKEAYAGIVKGVGLIAILAGGFLGGLVANRTSLITSLWIALLIQMLSNLAFVWQAWMGPQAWALTISISIENFAGGIGTVIFVSYIASLCTHPLHTATQFALLTALSSVGRTVLSSGSGYLVKAFGWPGFFIFTTLMALPAVLFLFYLQRKGHLQQSRPEHISISRLEA